MFAAALPVSADALKQGSVAACGLRSPTPSQAWQPHVPVSHRTHLIQTFLCHCWSHRNKQLLPAGQVRVSQAQVLPAAGMSLGYARPCSSCSFTATELSDHQFRCADSHSPFHLSHCSAAPLLISAAPTEFCHTHPPR